MYVTERGLNDMFGFAKLSDKIQKKKWKCVIKSDNHNHLLKNTELPKYRIQRSKKSKIRKEKKNYQFGWNGNQNHNHLLNCFWLEELAHK